ncbi:hypothetical protein [Brevundimonas naejangsanensis]|uniref:hypothetical protein n=1 Tax=Brevundimonas naejangsanensis TaxID=588932 RepID=UPI0026EA7ADA|nr:hypothetical protein [Brevundimonas naejangsanensis]
MTDWFEYQDDISDAISDSMDMDWSANDGARAVVRWLNENKPLSTTPRVTVPVDGDEVTITLTGKVSDTMPGRPGWFRVTGHKFIFSATGDDASIRISAAPAPEGGVVEAPREALIQADLKIRSLPGTDQSDVEFIRAALATRAQPLGCFCDEADCPACSSINPAPDKLRIAVEALEPFANLGVSSGPDDEPCHYAYRITRGAIRNARQALTALQADQGAK